MPITPVGCPCCSGVHHHECCGPILDGTLVAPTAERLMRSRFTAYALGNTDHLIRSWHPDTRPRRVDLDPRQRWTRLKVISTTGGGFLHTRGTVDFEASYRDAAASSGREFAVRENSLFTRAGGAWLYVEGV